jgi:hypothetical protein
MEEDIREDVRRAVYDLVWQTAHLYKDAPGGKLACPQRPKLERYVDSKMMMFDFMLDGASGQAEVKSVINEFLEDLESNFHTAVQREENLLLFYQERKEECLQVIANPTT